MWYGKLSFTDIAAGKKRERKKERIRVFIRRVINKIRKEISVKNMEPVKIKMRENLKNKDFSVISNNCTGGIIYHDLGLRFLSPTVNLVIPMKEYVVFLSDLKHNLQKPLKDCRCVYNGMRKNCPVAEIEGTGIHLIGVHYHSFDELNRSWTERAKRVRYDNLFVIGQYIDGCDDETEDLFCALPFEHKVFFTRNSRNQDKGAVTINVSSFLYPGKDVPGADVFADTKGTRLLYKYFDFVKWFNKGESS